MPYIIKYCPECGKEYHIHENGKIKGACEHIRLNNVKGRKTFKGVIANADELDRLLAEDEQHKTVAERWQNAK